MLLSFVHLLCSPAKLCPGLTLTILLFSSRLPFPTVWTLTSALLISVLSINVTLLTILHLGLSPVNWCDKTLTEGKTDEYSSKRAWSSIGRQYPEGLRGNSGTRAMVQDGANRVQKEGKGLIQYTRQKIRNQTTSQHKKTRLKLKQETQTRNGSVKQLKLGECKMQNNTGN